MLRRVTTLRRRREGVALALSVTPSRYGLDALPALAGPDSNPCSDGGDDSDGDDGDGDDSSRHGGSPFAQFRAAARRRWWRDGACPDAGERPEPDQLLRALLTKKPMTPMTTTATTTMIPQVSADMMCSHLFVVTPVGPDESLSGRRGRDIVPRDASCLLRME